jgi:RimJ/RimL family protein N-acetyltransferase
MANIWEGAKVRLRAVEPADWEQFFAWDHDSETARRAYFIPFPRSAVASRQWAEQSANEMPVDDAYRFAIETLEQELVGTLNTNNCDRRQGTFSYGIAIGAEYWRHGYASEAITLVLRYYFRELGYQKVTVHIYDFNEPSIRLHERLGFQHEGQLRRMIYTDGTYHDDLLYGLTAEEFAERDAPTPPGSTGR